MISLNRKLKVAAVGVTLALAAAGTSLAQTNGVSDNAWLQNMMKGMEMMGGKMKTGNMTDAKGMTASRPAMVIIDMRSGRMVAIDAAEASKYFSATP